MEATKEHSIWETGALDANLESLLEEYAKSVGSIDSGVPSEIVQGATRIDPTQARVLASGPADCTDPFDGTTHQDDVTDADVMTADQSAGILDGGVDDITPVQLWDTIMRKYKVAQTLAEEIHRLQPLG